MWTPSDNTGNLMRSGLVNNIEFLRCRGVHGILALGSTGEFPRLDLDKRVELLSLVAQQAGEMTTVANVSDVSLGVTLELARKAEEFEYDAIAVMPPGFFPLTQEDLLAYFLHVFKHTRLPVMLYNYPEVTGTRISMETISAFAREARMIGVKQSGDEFTYLEDLIPLGNELGFNVFAGTDTRVPEALALGASGSIGGLVNVVPEFLLSIYHNFIQERPLESEIPAKRLVEIGEIINRLPFPHNVAVGVDSRGLVVGRSKSVLSAQSRTVYSRVRQDLQERFETWNLEPASFGEDTCEKPSYFC